MSTDVENAPAENPYKRPLRLKILDEGRALHWLQRLQLKPIRWASGSWPNPHFVLSYRRNLFGKWFAAFTQRSMRESKYWPKEELELFAAYTANQLNCAY